ncbi:MAG: TVP38/TMEM64 family protein [Acidimicrobiia bacterium]
MTPRSRSILRLSGGVAVFVAMAVIASRYGSDTSRRLEESVRSHWWGPVLFVVVAALLIVLAVPGSLNTIAAGAIYGPVLGASIAVLAASVGATAAFVIGRRFGRSSVARLLGPRSAALDERLGHTTWRGLLTLRLLPIVPFNLLNYAAGLTSMSTRAYVAGTVIGIIPGTVALASVGGSAHDPTNPVFLSSVGVVVAMAAVTEVFGRRSRRRRVSGASM